jgi:hypothetical protein
VAVLASPSPPRKRSRAGRVTVRPASYGALTTGRQACIVRVPYFTDDVRAALAAEGITETFYRTNAEPESAEPTDVRVVVPGDTKAQADACLIRALYRLPGGHERLSAWHQMPAD